jgi:hypothetical protein
MDYSTTTLMVTFTPSVGGQMVCGNVPITDDNLGNEGDELFSVTITSVSSEKVMIGPNQESCVTILDDDSESKYLWLPLYRHVCIRMTYH